MKTNLPTAAIFLCLSIGSLALTSLGQATEPNPSEPTEAGTSKKTAAVAAKERKEYSEIIADNSYLVENAINIVPGNLHTMMSCTRFGSPSKNVNCGITQEIAVNGGKQLFSYSLPYSFLNSNQVRGAGDMAFSFRHQLTAEKDWAVISPRFTAFVPSGKHALGLGTASPALQFNLPVTKRLSEYFLASFNSGVTYVPRALGEDEAARPVRRGLVSYNVGGSLVWRANRSFNPLVEYVENFGSEIGPKRPRQPL